MGRRGNLREENDLRVIEAVVVGDAQEVTRRSGDLVRSRSRDIYFDYGHSERCAEQGERFQGEFNCNHVEDVRDCWEVGYTGRAQMGFYTNSNVHSRYPV